MTKNSFSFLLVSLVLCSGYGDVRMRSFQHFDHLNSENEMKFGYHDNKVTENMVNPRILCGACKKVVNKMLQLIGKTMNKDEVNQKIDGVCKKIKIPGCNRLVRKYKMKLVDALLSGDHANTICKKIKLCKKMYMYSRKL